MFKTKATTRAMNCRPYSGLKKYVSINCGFFLNFNWFKMKKLTTIIFGGTTKKQQ